MIPPLFRLMLGMPLPAVRNLLIDPVTGKPRSDLTPEQLILARQLIAAEDASKSGQRARLTVVGDRNQA